MISITALGAVTSVGPDAVTTCASIRAGLSRPAPLDGAVVLDMEDYKEVPVIGHPAGAIARGFSNVGRWLQLAPVAVSDLCLSGALPTPPEDGAFWADTKCIVALPFLDERFLPDPNCSEEAIGAAFVKPFRAHVKGIFAPSEIAVHTRGRLGVLESLTTAREWISRRQAVRVVIVVVDSLVDSAAIEWLLEADRIKCDANPIGLSPGEAACAFLLEDSLVANVRGRAAVARLGSIATAPEPKAFLAGDMSQGEALARVIEKVLSERDADASHTLTGPVIADLNGEQWRSHEFGCAQVRVDRLLRNSDRLVLPVGSTGDAGTATLGIQIAVACRALARGYAGGDSVLLTSSDERGLVGAAVISSGSRSV